MKTFVFILSLSMSISIFSQCLDTIKFSPTLYSNYKDTIVLVQNTKAATKALYICLWGDTTKMELHPNGKIYQFKSGLPDGMYIAYYDTNFKDTAMVAVIENGELNGVSCRWYNGHIEEICEYKNGRKNGWRKLYFYAEDYGWFINIEKCTNDRIESIYTEW